MEDDMTFCSDGKKCSEVVLDHTTGDTISTGCSLVLEARCIDDKPEWRTFSDDFGRENDHVRGGEAFNPLLAGGSGLLETFVIKLPVFSINKGGEAQFPLQLLIHMITQLSAEKKPLKDILLVTNVAESTIKSSYKDLYPHAPRVIPSSYVKEEDLRKLWRP